MTEQRGKLSALFALVKEGGYFDLELEGHKSVIRPAHATMLTGYLPDVHGAYSNYKFIPLPKGFSIFERLEKYKNKRFFASFHFGDSDHAGHRYGLSEEY